MPTDTFNGHGFLCFFMVFCTMMARPEYNAQAVQRLQFKSPLGTPRQIFANFFRFIVKINKLLI